MVDSPHTTRVPNTLSPTILTRPYSNDAATALTQAGLPPVFARVLAARGVRERAELDSPLDALLPYTSMRNIDAAARILADAIEQDKRLLIVGDYDADGATATAVGMRGLGAMGARVDYLVPNRFDFGYGLTPEIVQVAAQRAPDLLITVDNGIASVDGVASATRLGIATLITDHHIPGDTLPAASCIVNPNQAGCAFPSKHLAGVGVMFYVVMATRAELRRRGYFAGAELRRRGYFSGAEVRRRGYFSGAELPRRNFPGADAGQDDTVSAVRAEPSLANLLDLVALGTVADVVKLDPNNRLLVQQGLRRIRARRACAGIHALLEIAGRDAAMATAYDLGFVLGPRLNAAGRLQDISLGIECLLSDDAQRALDIARQLDRLNRERREIESDMQDSALAKLESLHPSQSHSITLFDAEWHQGVVGLVASRIKERFHRPTLAFARGNNGEVKGSGRSIAGLHLRDALDRVDKRYPGLLLRFGGHAAAAGVSLRESDISAFEAAFEAIAQQLLSAADLQRCIETDGSLADADISFSLARTLHEQVWGQGFPPPTFHDRFDVVEQRVVGEKHSRLKLRRATQGKSYQAMLYGHSDSLPKCIDAVYRLGINTFNESYSLELAIEHWQPG